MPHPTPSTPQVSTASGALLKMYGKRTMRLSFSGKPYSWTFITADVTIALLGADFLKAQGMLIQRDGPLTPITPRTTANPTLGPEIHCLLQKFLEEFKDVLQHDLTSPAKHHIKHHIITKGPPVHTHFRCLALDKLAYAKQVFHDMEQAEICQKASILWASPLHMVPKADGTWRHCSDYRQFNIKTIPDRHPLPT
ncbi:uncharacterized protein [Macrobrachium rosenbergii]|uniref:uncharacterized protein n=1 Tax=Macrobrachium rosenbergii TaxID=79674 RepID=UPI0034D6576F